MLGISFSSLFRRFSAILCGVVAMVFLTNISIDNVYAEDSTMVEQTLTQACIDQPYSGTIHKSSDADLALEVEKDCLVQMAESGMTAAVPFVMEDKVKAEKDLV